jgi:hypothetical protein
MPWPPSLHITQPSVDVPTARSTGSTLTSFDPGDDFNPGTGPMAALMSVRSMPKRKSLNGLFGLSLKEAEAFKSRHQDPVEEEVQIQASPPYTSRFGGEITRSKSTRSSICPCADIQAIHYDVLPQPPTSLSIWSLPSSYLRPHARRSHRWTRSAPSRRLSRKPTKVVRHLCAKSSRLFCRSETPALSGMDRMSGLSSSLCTENRWTPLRRKYCERSRATMSLLQVHLRTNHQRLLPRRVSRISMLRYDPRNRWYKLRYRSRRLLVPRLPRFSTLLRYRPRLLTR